MNDDLRAALPYLLPKAIAWAEGTAEQVARSGVPLDDYCLTIARRAEVAHPELIRVALVKQLPLPPDPQLREAALATGLLGPNMVGLTLGHGIFICAPCNSIRLLSHECRHVHQYEQAGSIAVFLTTYLYQIIEHGYANAPLELDARGYEVDS